MNCAVNVLMYHAISDAPGPTNIDPATFRGLMDALAARGYEAVPLSDLAAWHEGSAVLPARAEVITFDDGFADFAKQAAPILLARGWGATVFLPTGHLGAKEDWAGADNQRSNPQTSRPASRQQIPRPMSQIPLRTLAKHPSLQRASDVTNGNILITIRGFASFSFM